MTDDAPLLRVVRGEPTHDELAALVAVVSARLASGTDADLPTPSAYADPAAAHRTPVTVGPGAWVASGWVAGTRTRAAW